MTEEKKPLPALAFTAIRLATSEYERAVQAIAGQVLEGMSLSPNDGWQVNFTEGVAVRAVPEEPESVPSTH